MYLDMDYYKFYLARTITGDSKFSVTVIIGYKDSQRGQSR